MTGAGIRIFDERRHTQPAGHEVFFLAPAESFYTTLQTCRGSTITDRVFEHQFERLPAAQVLGAAAAKPMLVEAPAHITRNSGVKTAVSATQDVQAESIHDWLVNTRFVDVGCLPGIAMYDQALPPVSASPRTRNAPA